MKMDYRSAGVDIDKANELIKKISDEIRNTYSKYVISGVGGFGALVEVDLERFRNPVISISTDGVGTKLLLAKEYDKLEGIGIDLVAMNVDDVVCTGALPISFVDYYACGRLDERIYNTVLKSIAKGCEIAGVALVGGETAEMPGMYNGNDFDLSGTAVGIASKEFILPRDIRRGDLLLGIASSGFHSNGYSLVRKIIRDRNLDVTKDFGFGKPMIDFLLEPTRIYCRNIYSLIERRLVKAISHVTGGGIVENTLRVLMGYGMKLYKDKVVTPEFMKFIIREGKVNEEESFRVFNMGIGMVLAIDPKFESDVFEQLSSYYTQGEVYIIGEVV